MINTLKKYYCLKDQYMSLKLELKITKIVHSSKQIQEKEEL